VLVAAVSLGIYEIVQSLRRLGALPPMPPLLSAAPAMVVLAYREGPEALFLGLVMTVLACLAWRMADPAEGFLRDVAASTFTAAYVPFLPASARCSPSPRTGRAG
jgi:phosphatidate cytidylyltransferase